MNQLPQAVKDCLGADAQVQQVLQAYHIAGIPSTQVEEDITKFFLEHIFQLHKDAVTADNNFKSGNYAAVGNEGGVIAKQIFGSGVPSSDQLSDSVANLQYLYNGFFEQSELADPTTILSCYDQDSAQLTIDFIQTLMNDISSNNIVAAQADITKFEQQLPVPVQSCLKGDQEFQSALSVYGLTGWTLDQITTKLETYTVTHFLQIKKLAQIASQAFDNEDYVAVGKEGAVIAETVYGNTF